MSVGGFDHPEVIGRGDPLGQLRLLAEGIEAVRAHSGDQRPCGHAAQSGTRTAATAADVVGVHGIGQYDIAARVEAAHQLGGVVVEIRPDLVPAAVPGVPPPPSTRQAAPTGASRSTSAPSVRPWSPGRTIPTTSVWSGPNQWPSALPELREMVLRWQAEALRVSREVLRAPAAALGQGEEYFGRLRAAAG